MTDIVDVLTGRARYHIAHARREVFAPLLPDGCADLVFVDPPYFRVKDSAWDHAWDTDDMFVARIDACAREWKRVLAPSGSLYVCASPQMAARVEVTLARRFNVLNHIVWVKADSTYRRACKTAQRQYFTQTERIIFAEQQGQDVMARGETWRGADGTSDETAFVFEPIRAYLDGERQRSGVTRDAVERATGTQMFGHWFTRVQWALPTEANYAILQRLFNAAADGPRLDRPDVHLRREYDDLHREYERLRRPFAVERGVPTTDVWTYPFVQHYEGKHECEKPPAMLRDVILASSRPGDLVVDFFGGSFVACEQALLAGRRFLGCDADAQWVARGQQRAARGLLDAVSAIRVPPVVGNGPLFGG